MFFVMGEQRSLHTRIVVNMAMSKFDHESSAPFEKLVKNLMVVKSRQNRPVMLSEKITYSHEYMEWGTSYLRLGPNSVAMLQFKVRRV